MDVQYGSARRTPAPRSATQANSIPLGPRPQTSSFGSNHSRGNLLPNMQPMGHRPIGAMGSDPRGMRMANARSQIGQAPRPLLVSPAYKNSQQNGAMRPAVRTSGVDSYGQGSQFLLSII